jgi:hypothetical protein
VYTLSKLEHVKKTTFKFKAKFNGVSGIVERDRETG